MCSATPQSSSTRFGRRVAEDAEQDQRIGGQVVGEPRAVEPEGQRETAEHRLPEPRHRVHVVEHRVAQFGGLGREEVAGRAVATRWCLVVELGSEVEAFLLVRNTGGQLATQREPTPPGAAAARHGDLGLLGIREGEELRAAGVESDSNDGSTPWPTM